MDSNILIYQPMLQPYFNEDSGTYSLMIKFAEHNAHDGDGCKFLMLNEQDIANIVATFGPKFNNIDIEAMETIDEATEES